MLIIILKAETIIEKANSWIDHTPKIASIAWTTKSKKTVYPK